MQVTAVRLRDQLTVQQPAHNGKECIENQPSAKMGTTRAMAVALFSVPCTDTAASA